MTTVVLYSGGLDSFIGARLLEQREAVKRVYVDINSRYTERELRSIDDDTFILNGPDMSASERDDGFVPQRNLLFVTLAQAHFNADRVALCAVRGEYSRDKHRKFFRDASKLLSYTAGKPVDVFTPFARMTKSQAVKHAIATRIADPDALIHMTISCYSGQAGHCGRCMSCFRRWIALENNGIVADRQWQTPPWERVPQFTRREAVQRMLKLPLAAWPDFLLAQRDVVSAYIRLWRRQRHGNS